MPARSETDYDDDDRPRRGRRDDDDDFDDRPRRRPTGSNGVAVAALVLGLVSFFCSIFTGVPAVVCGILGLSQAKRAGGTGRGMAIAGIVLGGLSVVAIPVMIGLMLPAVQKVREAAARTQSVNNLKQISLGVQAYHDVVDHLPTADHRADADAPAPADPSRRLGWRFTVLPYLEQDTVYRQYLPTAGQPWDSPANRPLSEVRIRPYMDPTDPQGPAGDPTTRYRAFVGPKTLFDPAAEKPLKLQEITDGTSQTLLAAESADKVPWPQNNEMPYRPGGPVPDLGRPGQSAFLAVFADGHVQSFQKTIDPAVLRGMITATGGEVFVVPD